MAVPRNRLSNTRRNKRRAHDAKSPRGLSVCTNCGKMHRPHTLCEACGFYNGRPVRKQKEELAS